MISRLPVTVSGSLLGTKAFSFTSQTKRSHWFCVQLRFEGLWRQSRGRVNDTAINKQCEGSTGAEGLPAQKGVWDSLKLSSAGGHLLSEQPGASFLSAHRYCQPGLVLSTKLVDTVVSCWLNFMSIFQKLQSLGDEEASTEKTSS